MAGVQECNLPVGDYPLVWKRSCQKRLQQTSSFASKQVLLPVQWWATGDLVGDKGPPPSAATLEEVLWRNRQAGVYIQSRDCGHDQLRKRSRSIQTENLPSSSQSNSPHSFSLFFFFLFLFSFFFFFLALFFITEQNKDRQTTCWFSIWTLVPDCLEVAHFKFHNLMTGDF